MNSAVMEPIDAVIPWVDDTDLEWKTERNKYLSEFRESSERLSHYFRDWDTLRYVFRSIEFNMPWIRTVHFLTCGHLPDWLNTIHPKLRIHKHSEFFSKDSVLPMFSAHPIEMNLMNIEGLAERFIYFNDDTLVVKPVSPDRFFFGELPVDSLVWDFPRGGWLYDRIRIKDTYADICKNSIHLILSRISLGKLMERKNEFLYHRTYPWVDRMRNRFFNTIGVHEWIKVNHHPQAHTLSNLRTCQELFGEAMRNTARSRFRTNTDVNQYLYRNYALLSGNFYPYFHDDSFCVALSSVEYYNTTRHNLTEKTLVCLNDSLFLKEEEYPLLKQMVARDLKQCLPLKSNFEK